MPCQLVGPEIDEMENQEKILLEERFEYSGGQLSAIWIHIALHYIGKSYGKLYNKKDNI